MSVNGINTVQAAMLRVLLNKDNASTDQAGTFADILQGSLAQGADTGSLGFSQDGLTQMLLTSMLGGGSSMMMLSLGNALLASRQQIGTNGPLSFDLSQLVTPERASRPTTPAVTSHAHNRSAGLYNAVIAQFSVETNPRYAPNKKGTGDTYCNIFVWDVTSAMGAEIPHYIDQKTGAPMSYPNVSGARHMSANAKYDWLHKHGSEYGWYEVSAEEAQALANRGQPVVATLRRSGKSGHIQMVCPSKDGSFDPQRGVMIAQAGSRLTSYAPITSIYGKQSLSQVKYFAHR